MKYFHQHLNSPFWQMTLSDIQESYKARWFRVYFGGFALLMTLFFAYSLADSSIMGFTGLGRGLLSFIQIAVIILPLFVMITTARTFVADRESGVWEYLLSWPISLKAFFWGKACGRLIVITLPLMIAMLAAGVYESIQLVNASWFNILFLTGFVCSMTVCFLGIGLCISVMASTQEKAIGTAFGLWILLEALIDSLLLGVMVKGHLQAEVVVGLALLNPLQGFRTASIALFDPELSVLGPISYALVNDLGIHALLIWALVWPVFIGVSAALIAGRHFHKLDITG